MATSFVLRHGVAGRRIVNVDLSPTALVTAISPPISSQKRRAIASPSPAPP
jgi:hypothetical protein